MAMIHPESKQLSGFDSMTHEQFRAAVAVLIRKRY